ncbi:hypothetical protein [Neisseria sp.]|uniref:hypothetical protein n=1 Tax=Neisseria sp. TaxID=192066 RepID=UPI0026DCF89F|nr:hypothetical protein [Neisseria sp.]
MLRFVFWVLWHSFIGGMTVLFTLLLLLIAVGEWGAWVLIPPLLLVFYLLKVKLPRDG